MSAAHRSRPPRLPRMWLAITLPHDDRETYLGDLEEGYSDRAAAIGAAAANRWYWREALHAPTRWSRTRFALPAARGALWKGRLGRIASDLRSAIGQFRRHAVASTFAALTLAIGIGATVAMFTVVSAVMLRPLPVADPDRLVVLREVRPSGPGTESGVSYPNFRDWQQHTTSFSSMAIVGAQSVTLEAGGSPVRVNGLLVSKEFFQTLGVRPALGTAFEAADDRGRLPTGEMAVIVSHSGWLAHFGGRPDVVGQLARVDGQAAVVVGVTARNLFPVDEEPIDLWALPAVQGDPSDPRSANGSRTYRGYAGVVARLRDGVRVTQARTEVLATYSAMAARFPAQNAGREARVERLRDVFVDEDTKATLYLLLGLVGVVLLIACVNVANMLLARATARRRDVAVRMALGAGRWDVVRLCLVESVLLALIGGVVGLLGAAWVVNAVAALMPAALMVPADLSPDWRVFTFALMVSTLAGALAGLAPATTSMRGTDARTLTSGGRTIAGAIPRRLGEGLIAMEIGMAVIVLSAAGLLVNSLVRLQLTRPGFEVAHVLTVRLALDGDRYAAPKGGPQRINEFLERLAGDLRGLPGVSHVAFAQSVPLTGVENSTRFSIDDEPPSLEPASAQLRFASGDFFAALGIPVVSGRVFQQGDGPGAPAVALVNEAFVQRHLPGRDPVGRSLRLGWGGDGPKRIVGVVGDVRHRSLGDAPRPEMYVPQAQFGNTSVTVLVRGTAAVDSLGPAILGTIRAIDPALPLPVPRSLEDYRRATLAVPRVSAWLIGGFGAVALALTVIGLYGVTSYGVAQRTREIGVRVAFGAQVHDVRRLVMGQALRPVGVGLGCGLAVSVVTARGLRAWIFGIAPTDPPTYAAVLALVGLVAVAACAVPARRAARIDPLRALRHD